MQLKVKRRLQTRLMKEVSFIPIQSLCEIETTIKETEKYSLVSIVLQKQKFFKTINHNGTTGLIGECFQSMQPHLRLLPNFLNFPLSSSQLCRPHKILLFLFSLLFFLITIVIIIVIIIVSISLPCCNSRKTIKHTHLRSF